MIWLAEAYCESDAVLLSFVPADIVENCRGRFVIAGARERQPVIFAVIYAGPAAWIIIRGAGTAKILPFYRLHPCIAVTRHPGSASISPTCAQADSVATLILKLRAIVAARSHSFLCRTLKLGVRVDNAGC